MSDEEGIARIARTLAAVAQALSAADDPRGRLRQTLERARDLVSCARCAFCEVTADGAVVLHVAPDVDGAGRRALVGRLRRLYRLFVGSPPSDGLFDEPTEADGPAHLALPVLGLDRTLGLLVCERDGPAYDEQDVRLLSVVAAQLGAWLTTLRLREEELEHARELAAAVHRLEETDRRKDEFLAMLGHELRNPLGAITTALYILDRREPDRDDRHHRVIDRQIKYLSRIVDDLLDAARVRLGKIVLERRTVDVGAVASRWMEAFGHTTDVKTHRIELSLPAEPVVVDGDPIRLEQVFSNLLTNALKYTPAGGSVTVAVAVDGGSAVVRVRDTGIGMTPETLASVFDLFTQADHSLARSQGGLGLGLPLVRSLVEAHGGTVEARSDGLGLGSEFVVRLPTSTSLVEDLSTDADDLLDTPLPAERLRIVLVEDNADVCEGLRVVLEGSGHEVHVARDGVEGVERILDLRPDVALVDIGLPMVDGYELARRVRSRVHRGELRLIAMTGYGQPEDRRRALEAGFDRHLVKPVDLELLDRELLAVRRADSSRG